ncbi:MAG: hypothetical protein WEB89_06890 [Balneolales bacterium]
MKKKITYYVLLFTGILIILVGLQNLVTYWGQGDFAGFIGQVTGVVCLIGGSVNVWVANNVKKGMPSKDIK